MRITAYVAPHTYTNTFTHTHLHTHIHTHSLTHTHTCTRTHSLTHRCIHCDLLFSTLHAKHGAVDFRIPHLDYNVNEAVLDELVCVM
jgi:hypothetical protein